MKSSGDRQGAVWQGWASTVVAFLLVLVPMTTMSRGESQEQLLEEAPSSPPPVDERIREQLDALELNYDITDRNNFVLLFTFDDGRSQEVLIRSQTWTSHDLEVRDIWSTAYRHRTRYLPEHLERRLLKQNYELVAGNWARRNNDVIYMVKLPAEAGAEALQAALYDVSEVADELEEEMTGAEDAF